MHYVWKSRFKRLFLLLLAEAHAIGASGLGGIALMGTNLNGFQCAVVCLFSVICTGSDGAMDCLVFEVHSDFLLEYCEK